MDVLESFAAIKAKPVVVWPFVTQVDRVSMWISPLAELAPPPELRTLEPGTSFDLVLFLPGRPVLHCLVLSLADDAIATKFDGFIRGMMTWRVVPAGGGSIAHGRVKYAWVCRPAFRSRTQRCAALFFSCID